MAPLQAKRAAVPGLQFKSCLLSIYCFEMIGKKMVTEIPELLRPARTRRACQQLGE
jgi:hypothetical protein